MYEKNARKLGKCKILGKINSSVYCSGVSSPSHVVRGEVTGGEKGAEVFKSNKGEPYAPSYSVSGSSFVQKALRAGILFIHP